MLKLLRIHNLLIFLVVIFYLDCKPKSKKTPTPFELGKAELHGHRGCRGLYPENSLPAFINAIKFGVDVLELDVCISKDKKVYVSHEPYFNPRICLGDSTLNLYTLTYHEIKQVDCGSLPYAPFPEQQKIKVYKPLLSEVIDSVERFCKRNNLPPPKYNIELKSVEEEYSISQPLPGEFVKLVHETIDGTGIYVRTYIQSFDPNILREYNKIHPLVKKSFLVDNNLSLMSNIRRLGFFPKIYSPNYEFVTQSLIDSCHKFGMQIVPWTVNDVQTARQLLNMGVDGIISDYPNRMQFMRR